MEAREFLLGQGGFKSPKEIIETIQQSGKADADGSLASAEALLIFQTSKQQTWLVATKRNLYCVLDDLPRAFTKVQWLIGREKLLASGSLAVAISTRDKTDRTGLLDIGERKGWLFSKKLFASEPIATRVGRLITNQMATNTAIPGAE